VIHPSRCFLNLHKRWICKATKRQDCDNENLGGAWLGAYLILLLRKEYDFADTVLIGATDGIGTKLKIAVVCKWKVRCKPIAESCKQAECGLIGDETAEMPSMYSPGEYDLAGFAVGAIHRNCILLQSVEVGDILLQFQRSREHSNGFSLLQKLLKEEGLFCNHAFPLVVVVVAVKAIVLEVAAVVIMIVVAVIVVAVVLVAVEVVLLVLVLVS
jgi:phosphoribosylaminoimidazole (AIR) synthetase